MTEKSTFGISLKSLAIFLAVLMSISLFPMNVFAATTADEATECVQNTASDGVATDEASKNTAFGSDVFSFIQMFTYECSGQSQYSRIAEYIWSVNGASTTYTYTYDQNGNITKVMEGAGIVEQYSYDKLGQLLRADIAAVNTTYVYQYDPAGNRTVKREYPLSFTSSLGTQKAASGASYFDNSFSKWDDQLGYVYGQATKYDFIGNLTQIGDYGDGSATPGKQFVWQGRLLMEYVELGDFEGETLDVVTFTYNSDGIRTSKQENGNIHRYILDGTRVVAEELSEDMVLLVYIYDESGSPIGMKYQGPTYATDQFDYFFFQKNLQGDIVAVYNEDGTLIGSYVYGPWGEMLDVITYDGNTTLQNRIVADYNPFRYRGYFYDWETDLYYLQSRYYNPEWGRFINADAVDYLGANGDLNSYNLYAYCSNNPVMNLDDTGNVTITKSLGVNATALFGIYLSVSISYDHHGNIAFSYSYAVSDIHDTAYIGGLDAGIACSSQVTLLDSVDDLSGKSGYVGASGGYIGYFGADAVFLPDNYENKGIGDSSWIGAQLSAGLGAGADFHIIEANTVQSKSFNVFRKLVGWVTSWFN